MKDFNSTVEIFNTTVTFRKEKIVQLHYRNHLYSLQENAGIFALISERSPWHRPLLLVTGDDFYNHDTESKKFFANESVRENFTAVAFVANNVTQKMVINLFIKMYEPKVQMKYFYSEEEAVDWLTGFIA